MNWDALWYSYRVSKIHLELASYLVVAIDVKFPYDINWALINFYFPHNQAFNYVATIAN